MNLMRRFKTFFYSFKRSLVDPTYYSEFAENDSDFSFRYLYGLNILTYLLISIVFFVTLTTYVTRHPQFFSDFFQQQLDRVPADYEASLKNKQFVSNFIEPLSVALPSVARNFIHSQKGNVILIAPEQPIEDYEGLDSMLFINQDAAVFRLWGKTRILFFANLPISFTVSRASIASVIVLIQSVLKFWYITLGLVLIIIIGLSFLLGFFWTIVQSLILFLATSIFYLLSLVLRKKATYTGMFHILMQGLTWPIVLALLFRLFSPVIFSLPPYFLVLLVVIYTAWMVFVVTRLREFHAPDADMPSKSAASFSTEPPMPKPVPAPSA